MSNSPNSEKLYLTFSLKNCEQNILYKISASIEESLSKFKEHIETEEKQCFEYNSLIIFSQKMLCNFYFERNQIVKIEITKKSNKDKGIMERMTVLSSLISSPNSIYERKINNKENSEKLCIKLERENKNLYENNNSLFEYFKSGLKLSCFISMDFSNIKLRPSLIDTKVNYVELLKNISFIFSNYTNNHLFYVYGFGANFLYNKEIFNINLKKNDSKINTINEVVKYFKLCLINNFIKGENYINLSPIIKKISKEIYKINEKKHYNTAFIIIRGVIDQNDINKTIDAIIESSLLPLTIFVIGVGKNDFSQMNNIFSYNNKFSSTGIEKKRNNAFFVSLIQNFSNDAEKLISWSAEELYKQIINYYDLIKTTPKDIYENNLKNIENMFNLYNSSIITSFLKNKNSYNQYNGKGENHNIDKYKKEENSYNKNMSLRHRSQNSNNINNINKLNPQMSNDSDIFFSILENDNKNNNQINNNNNNKNKKGERYGEFVFTPTPNPDDVSIYPKIKGNPYCEKIEIKEENKPKEKELNHNNSSEKSYNIPNPSVINSNRDKNYYPYMKDKQNIINENIKQSNNYISNYNYISNNNNQNIEQNNNYSNYNAYIKNNNINENIEQSYNYNNYNSYINNNNNENLEQSSYNNYNSYVKNNNNIENIEQSNNYNNYNPYLQDTKKQINKNNYVNNYNPYLEGIKKEIDENNEKNNNLIEQKKIDKISGASELNSTKNSENIKESNFFLFNDNYFIDKSNMK